MEKEGLQEGKKFIKKIIKLIRLADRGDWSLMIEYNMSDDMASNSSALSQDPVLLNLKLFLGGKHLY